MFVCFFVCLFFLFECVCLCMHACVHKCAFLKCRLTSSKCAHSNKRQQGNYTKQRPVLCMCVCVHVCVL